MKLQVLFRGGGGRRRRREKSERGKKNFFKEEGEGKKKKTKPDLNFLKIDIYRVRHGGFHAVCKVPLGCGLLDLLTCHPNLIHN